MRNDTLCLFFVILSAARAKCAFWDRTAAVSVTALQKSITDTVKRNRVNHGALEKREKCPSSNKDKVGDVSVASGPRSRSVCNP